MAILGIDIGGSSLKGAMVNIETGQIEGDAHTIPFTAPTPADITQADVTQAVCQMAQHFKCEQGSRIGCTFPGVIRSGKIEWAGNITQCIGMEFVNTLSELTSCQVVCLNDADSAGLAEVSVGAGAGVKGTVITITLGTGIGGGFFNNGRLIPNCELGHLRTTFKELNETLPAEYAAAASVLAKNKLSWEIYAARLNDFFAELHKLFWPELIIVGGGVSADWDAFGHLLTVPHAQLKPAHMRNAAGLVGAALYTTHMYTT